MVEAGHNFFHNKTETAGNTAPLDREIFSYALGRQPLEELKTWKKSNYSPTISKDKNVEYISPSKDAYNYPGIENVIEDYNREFKGKELPKSSHAGGASGYFKEEIGFDPLAQHTVGFGEDEVGKYMSIADVFDLNNPLANMLLAKNPEIYDRFYYSTMSDKDEVDEINRRSKELYNLKESQTIAEGVVDKYMNDNVQGGRPSTFNREEYKVINEIQRKKRHAYTDLRDQYDSNPIKKYNITNKYQQGLSTPVSGIISR